MRTRGVSKKSSAVSGEGGPGSCLWDLLSDDVVAYEIISKIPAALEDKESAPFHPRLILQCARKGVFVWSPKHVSRLLSLKPVGPFIQEVQEALRSKFEGSSLRLKISRENDASHPLFACKNLKCLNVTFKGPDALQGLPKLSATLQDLQLRLMSRRATSKLADNLAPLTRLTSLSLTVKKGNTALDCAFLNHLTALRSLGLSISRGSREIDLSAVHPLPALESLHLDNVIVYPETLAPFDRAPKLTSLNLSVAYLEDAPLSRLSTLTSLARLEIKHVHNLPETLPANLLKGLTSYIQDSTTLPTWLSSCTDLRDVKADCELAHGADGLALLQPLTRLTSLHVRAYYRGPSDCTSLSPLSSLIGIQVLYLEGFDLMQDFSALSRLTALAQLTIRGAFLAPFTGFSALASLPSLRHLEVASVQSFAEGQFEHLARLTTLTRLSLSGLALDDAILPYLRPLAVNLRSLDLCWSYVIGRGLHDVDTFMHLTNLRELDLRGRWEVTAKGLRCLSSLERLKKLSIEERLKEKLEKIRASDPSFLPGVDVS